MISNNLHQGSFHLPTQIPFRTYLPSALTFADSLHPPTSHLPSQILNLLAPRAEPAPILGSDRIAAAAASSGIGVAVHDKLLRLIRRDAAVAVKFLPEAHLG